MATIEQNTPSGRRVRMSAKVDFTAMVDLGFLLITFFMLTTSLSKPYIMPVVMPENDAQTTVDQKENEVVTLLLGPRDKIYFYEGITHAQLDSTDYNAQGLRQVLLLKMDQLKQDYGEEWHPDPKNPNQSRAYSRLNVLIKAMDGARYKNIVDVFDELKICGVAHYVLMPIAQEEIAFVKNPAQGLLFDAQAQLEALR